MYLFQQYFLSQQYKHNNYLLHKSKVTTTATKAGDADLDAAEDTDCNDNNHDDTATVTLKITAKQCFPDTKLYIF